MWGNSRSTFFWFLDFLKGNTIFNNLKEIRRVNNSDIKEILNYQDTKLQELLSYTIQNVPFYKKSDFKVLNDFPIVNKIEYKNNLDSFCSSQFKRESLFRVVTSGSTGTPFVSYQNKEKKQRNTADALYFSELAGYKFGETLLYLKIWSANNKKSKRIQWMQNIVPVDVIELSGEKVKSLISDINKRSNKININAYASALEEICKYLDKSNSISVKEHIIIESIIAQSEALTSETKSRLYTYFKCQPCSRYSNVENGILAQQTKEVNNLFKINCASYKIEILKLEEDVPAEKGELGRIVITDLFNYAMPFIRYDTGDIGRFYVTDNGEENLTFLKEIQGRKLDLLLNTQGEVISSYIMYKNMFQYPEIDQYQLIHQSKKEYRFIISIKGNFNKEEKLKKEFLTYLGSDADFDIEYVDKIPLLASGKRRKIVNNYLKNNSEK